MLDCNPKILGGCVVVIVILVVAVLFLLPKQPKSGNAAKDPPVDLAKRVNDQHDSNPQYQTTKPKGWNKCGLDIPYDGSTCPAHYAKKDANNKCYFTSCRAKTEFEYKQSSIEGSSAGTLFLGPVTDKTNELKLPQGISGLQMERVVANYSQKDDSEFLKQILGKQTPVINPDLGVPAGASLPADKDPANK